MGILELNLTQLFIASKNIPIYCQNSAKNNSGEKYAQRLSYFDHSFPPKIHVRNE